LFIVLSLTGISGQTTGKNGSKSKPFAAGEVLTYEGKLSKIINGMAVADLIFSVTNSPSGNNFLIRSEAKSKGSLVKLLRFSFLQNLESTIDNENFRILKTLKHDQQKDRVRDSEAVFDYKEKKVTFVERDPKEPNRPPRKFASSIPNNTHDLVSGIYALRLLPLAVGKTFELTVSDSGLIYKVPVRVTARELQKTAIGKIICFRLEPDIFGPNRMIEDKGHMIIWITDDAKRIPVRSQISVSLGKLELKLKSASEVGANLSMRAPAK